MDTSDAEYSLDVFYKNINSKNIDNSTIILDISNNLISPFNASDLSSIKEFIKDVSMFRFNGNI